MSYGVNGSIMGVPGGRGGHLGGQGVRQVALMGFLMNHEAYICRYISDPEHGIDRPTD